MHRKNAIERVLSVGELRKRLEYNPETGVLRFKAKAGTDRATNSWNARFAGAVTGSLTEAGYLAVNLTVNGKSYLIFAHRLAWALMSGDWAHHKVQIDHINGVRDDNRWINLRKCAHEQNGKNRVQSAANKTGFKGVVLGYKGRRWIAQIRENGKSHYLGYFDDPKAAALAYDAAAIRLHGEYARTNASMGLL